MADIIVPIPDRDFDTTEVSVPWHVLTSAGHRVIFATEKAERAQCDPLLLTGVIFGQLGAKPRTKELYKKMEQDAAFVRPIRWSEIAIDRYDAMLLPGGHAPGMKQYLGSEELQSTVASFWATGKPVAAICHGTIVLARATDPKTGKSVLDGRKTTCLPKFMERTAWLGTAWKLGSYYRTYPEWVEDEVRRSLGEKGVFERGPFNLSAHGTETDDSAAFVVEDGSYVSARWPGDAWLFARKLLDRLDQKKRDRSEHANAT